MKVAVIGSGASGLASVKCCLDEGLLPVCFEQDHHIGGLWQFTEDAAKTSSVYRSTVINTSKEMMCFSDFPVPKEFPPYMHHTLVAEYFELYAAHFGLHKYIRFGCEVLRVERTSDFETSGKWIVKYRSAGLNHEKRDGEEMVEEFDAVMLCTGHYWQPSWPSFKGMDIFKGVQMHSHSYKDFRGFEGKNVLIVGIGNSACDIAVELSRHAKQVYLSTRRGAWFVSRLHTRGLPTDHYTLTRFNELIPSQLNEYLSQKACNAWFSHKDYGLLPTHNFQEQHPIINDGLPTQIITGAVVIKPNVEGLTQNGAIFTNGTSIDQLDHVIFCTGYDVRFPYLEIEGDILKTNNQVTLYKYVFPPFLQKPTLAVVGNIQPSGAVNPVSELQARWAAQVFSGKLKLPSEERMMQDIKDKWEAIWKQYYYTKRSTFKVEHISYCDELAEMIGCKPKLLKLFLTDPLLSLKCFFGPCTPPQYRLMGPGSWNGAKQAIENVNSNVIYATKTRVVKPAPLPSGFISVFALALVVMFMIALI